MLHCLMPSNCKGIDFCNMQEVKMDQMRRILTDVCKSFYSFTAFTVPSGGKLPSALVSI